MSLPIEDLPAWSHLNDVSFSNVKVTNTEGKGYGVLSQTDLTAAEGTTETPILLTVPHNLVLNAAAVEEHAKEDKDFRQLLEALELRSARTDILLFLLVQTARASRTSHPSVGVSNPWAEYLQFLPKTVSVPTMWPEQERLLLRGTSLWSAVDAKLRALSSELQTIHEASSGIPGWDELLWEGNNPVFFSDWVRLDALYRSRCLELPRSGESMVPCIDMINHSSSATAYYDENSKDEVVLRLRPRSSISGGEEVTISYGDNKSAAEMLFSYGFIDTTSTAESLVLPLMPFADDPLAKAKLVAFGKAPKLHVARENGTIRWESEFAHLKCVNEEDGLEFRVLQETDGGRQLRVFWKDEDVTDRTAEFEELNKSHDFPAVMRLRTVVVVEECLQAQLDWLEESQHDERPSELDQDCVRSATLLRQIEAALLRDTLTQLEQEKNSLLASENVVAYLGSMETASLDLAGAEASNEDEDFS
ncbi:hypothetical protein QBC35DRAFT_448159 [Podospora australis]|uniref:SET domain-containing protein n=1 Tax=Podospora australis TaxID=1536484 RepID=A0AAN6X0H8_9PEZI|nr:hypothetical protein QBC35DRAFT_448159 [Podospora australis]